MPDTTDHDQVLVQVMQGLEKSYYATRKDASEYLHKEFVKVIQLHRPSIETLLYVLERLKVTVVQQAIEADSPAKRVQISTE